MPPPKRQRTNKELTAEIADFYMKDRDKFVAGDKIGRGLQDAIAQFEKEPKSRL